MRYLICAFHRRLGCRARAHVPIGGAKHEVQVTRMHNHPPDDFAEERDFLLEQLKTATRSLPYSLREIYSSVAMLHPRVVEVVPFTQIQSSMNRWRNKTLTASKD